MIQFYALLFAVLSILGVSATSAHAALTVPVLSDVDFLAVAGAILVLIAGFYGVRKALGLLGR